MTALTPSEEEKRNQNEDSNERASEEKETSKSGHAQSSDQKEL